MNTMNPRRRAWLALGPLLAPTVLRAESSVRMLNADASHRFAVHSDGPDDANAGVVLVHDWFGVSPFFLQGIERLGRLGLQAVGVDLYDGHRATTHDEAAKLMNGVDMALAQQKIDAAIARLTSRPRKLAIIGFSMGGKPALETALRHKEIVATAVWYGETINDAARLKNLSGPVLYLVGSRDGPAAAQNAAAFSKAADEAGGAAEVHVFPGAAHAFAQPLFNGGKTYQPVLAEASWQITEGFLRRHLTGTS